MQRVTIIMLTVLAFTLNACRQEDDVFDGPSLNDIYGEFSFVEPFYITNENVDFAAGQSTAFVAEFSKNVNWQIQITGLTSGAIKTISGTSNYIDTDNATWYGSTTILPMFRAELCAVELTFSGEADTVRDTLEILTPKVHDGFILADFESGMPVGWEPFVQAGADMSFTITNTVTAGQGQYYYDMGGEVNWDWLIGLVDIPASAYGSATFPLSSNPDNVFFNVMLYNPPAITNSVVLFQFREDDNGDGTFSEGTEDMWAVEIKMTDPGWQLISRNYSELATLINGVPADPLGNGIHEADKLFQVSVLMLANPSSGYSQALMDYMIFTDGAALEP